MKRLLTLLAMAAMLVAAPAQAWWEYGHETVARIAMRNVRPSTRAAVSALLARSAALDTPTCPARTPEQASVWADCIKKLGDRFAYASSWHYQNVNVCKPFDLSGPCKDGNCVSAQIERAVAQLKQGRALPVRDRVMALAFLIHFVGDLHQPMHAGDRDDLGGNRVKAAYGDYRPERLNLHAVWDGWLAERAISTPPPLVRRYAPAERRRLAAGTIDSWSRESWQVSRDFAYATAMGGDPCAQGPARSVMTPAEIDRLVPVVRDEVTKGGLRLARLLDEALG